MEGGEPVAEPFPKSHGCSKKFQLALVGFAFRSEAEEGASRRRLASCEEDEAAAPQAYSLYGEDADAEG